MNKYANSMAVGVMDLANKVVDKKKILTETDGRVVGTSGDKYIVEIKGEQYTIPSINGATFELNKTVKVIQPNGATDVTGQYIIGGKVDVGSIVSGVTSVNGHTGSIITLDKTDIGLGNVDNVKQATKTEFDTHAGNTGIHVTSTEKTLWDTVTDKADKTSVLTDVPENALFTDTVTTINGKTGAILKDDIVALGIPEQDTVYVHPATHPASMITGLSPVSTSGAYADLSGLPNVPIKTSELENDSGFFNQLPVHIHDDRYYTKNEVDNLISGGTPSYPYGDYEPLANGDVSSPELIFYNGDIVMGKVN